MIRSKKSNNTFWVSFALLLCLCGNSYAQGFSYVYIQGDKKTPIYTKVEGVMMPRYGKNYALISRLAPGPLNVEILFQQNEYPPLNFMIMVPEHGKRAFVLTKKDNEFSLFDVEQNFYLKSGNDINDDHLPTVLDNSKLVSNTPAVTTTTPEIKPVETVAVETPASENNTAVVAAEPKQVQEEEVAPEIPKEHVQVKAPPETNTPVKTATEGQLQFIEHITFVNDTSKKAETTEASTATNSTDNQVPKVTNSDCASAMSAGAFQKLQNSINLKKTEDERLGLILMTAKQQCFSTEQTRQLILKMDSDIARFSALKTLYPKITDQGNFAELENLLDAADWKESFRNMVQPK